MRHLGNPYPSNPYSRIGATPPPTYGDLGEASFLGKIKAASLGFVGGVAIGTAANFFSDKIWDVKNPKPIWGIPAITGAATILLYAIT